jgi:hypothetical protein
LAAVEAITRRLTAFGFTVERHDWRDWHVLVISGVSGGRSCLTFTAGQVRWYHEFGAGPGTDPVALTAIIARIFTVPAPAAAAHQAYRAFPLKGRVGRLLQDAGLTVNLRVCEDLESFEATTDIEITSPERPWLGTVRLSDHADLEWDCGHRARFPRGPGAMIDLIAPVLRDGLSVHPA